MQTCCDPPAKVHLVAQYQPQPKTTHLLSWEVSCNTGRESISELDSTFSFLSSQAVPKPAAQDNGSVRGGVWVCAGEAREQRGFKVV